MSDQTASMTGARRLADALRNDLVVDELKDAPPPRA